MNKQIIRHKLLLLMRNSVISLRMILLSLLTGALAGLCSTFFTIGLRISAIIHSQNRWLLWLLPVGGLATVAIYHLFRDPDDVETNFIISSIKSKAKLPFRVAPLMFISTILTSLLGGSAGGEAPALQLGGSIADEFGRKLHLSDEERNDLILSGMSAGLSALLGTPMAAAFLSLEITETAFFHYSALLPCVLSSLTASKIARAFGVYGENLRLIRVPIFRLKTALIIAVLSLLAALVSVLFLLCCHSCENLYKDHLKNHYIRAFAGGAAIVLLTFLSRSHIYNGAGTDLMLMALKGESPAGAFLLKIIFTAVTLGAGFKGGEILPAMTVGATFGCFFGTVIGFSPAFCAAVAVLVLFCGITGSPVASLLLGFELFGYDGLPYYLLAVSICYYLSALIYRSDSDCSQC